MPIELMPEGADIFASECEAIAIPVNCVGVAGAGLALAAKSRWPQWFNHYRTCCTLLSSASFPAIVCLTRTGVAPFKLVVSAATKDHWRSPSGLQGVARAINGLVITSRNEHLLSIAVPALGCGMGGLTWDAVLPLLTDAFEGEGVLAKIYPPRGHQ